MKTLEGKTLMRLQQHAAGEKPGTKEGEVDTFINNGRRNKTSRSSGAYTLYNIQIHSQARSGYCSRDMKGLISLPLLSFSTFFLKKSAGRFK